MTKSLLLSGNANLLLSEKIAKCLNQPLGKMRIEQFADGETHLEILDSVLDKDVYIIQSTSTPTNHHMMELLLIANAVKYAGACHITAVIPYFGYARQNISAKVMANLLTTVGIEHVITVDLHTDPQDIFFEKSIYNLNTTQLFLNDFIEKIASKKHFEPLVVSPDKGGVTRAKAFSEKLNPAEFVMIEKHRPHPHVVEITNINGNVKDRDCVIIDDMIDTGSTVCSVATALKAQGAKSVMAYITHPLLSGNAVKKIVDSPIEALVVTDTIPLSAEAEMCEKIRMLSVSRLIRSNLWFQQMNFQE